MIPVPSRRLLAVIAGLGLAALALLVFPGAWPALLAADLAVFVAAAVDLAVTPRFRGAEHREAVGRLTIAFNEALARKSRAHGAELVDLFAASRREVPLRPELMSADSYHPSDVGYARWAELVWAGVEARIAGR